MQPGIDKKRSESPLILSRRSAASVVAGGLVTMVLAGAFFRRSEQPPAPQDPSRISTTDPERWAPTSVTAQDPARVAVTSSEAIRDAGTLIVQRKYLEARKGLETLLQQRELPLENAQEAQFLVGVAFRELGAWEDAQRAFSSLLRSGDTNPLRVGYAKYVLQEMNDVLGPAVPFGMVRIPAGRTSSELWKELAREVETLEVSGPLSAYLMDWKVRARRECDARVIIEERWGEFGQVGVANAARQLNLEGAPSVLFLLARAQVEFLEARVHVANLGSDGERVLANSKVEVFRLLSSVLSREEGTAAAVDACIREQALAAEYSADKCGSPEVKEELHQIARWALREVIRAVEADPSEARRNQLPGHYAELSRFEGRVENVQASIDAAAMAVTYSEQQYGDRSLEVAISLAGLISAQMQQKDSSADRSLWRNREKLTSICLEHGEKAQELYESGESAAARGIFDRINPLLPFVLPENKVRGIVSQFYSGRSR